MSIDLDDSSDGWRVHVVAYLSGRFSEGELVEELKGDYGFGSLMVIRDSMGSSLNLVPAGADLTVLMMSGKQPDRSAAEALAETVRAVVEPMAVEARVEVRGDDRG